ncbi:hypothetical protein EDEG_02234 [Edhazardia aedis USNM 41457]|uniref:MCM C-terminal AAA(+) ATPase domain-containing protein n=1 Tax=Edhazardia aedis (strain USNM 41457) TaxID=1003232 RepID=J9D7H0_EDHAE|nr:hypothetical protein EDEG_02234 [Edhazardia aedis USNM 41457]|eukprot:EJW03469.1 hypothetical protein EDEG_02234 [Edhazardia aedis USNM 41457]
MNVDIPTEFFTSEIIDLYYFCNKYPEFTNLLISSPLSIEGLLYNKKFKNIPACLAIPACLSKKHYNKIVKIEGTIIKVGPLLYKNIHETFICVNCKTDQSINDKVSRKKLSCINCDGKNFEKKCNLDNISTYQTLRLQDVGNEGPLKTVEVVFEGRQQEKIIPGDKVIVTGVVMLNMYTNIFRDNEPLKYNYCLRGLHMNILCNEVIPFASKEYDTYKNEPNKRKYILDLFCPKIYGLNHIKLGLILSLVGNINENRRMNSHILIIGDPGLGKTDLLKYCSKIISPSRMINGLMTSEVGLTACAVKHDKDWGLEAGALVVTDGGICCIDNFDSLNLNEKGGLLEAMEQQTVSVAKAGMNVKFNARCSIIAASGYKNKKFAGFDLKNSLNISAPLLSRFDLVFGLFSKRDHIKDEKIADLILSDVKSDSDINKTRYLLNTIQRRSVIDNKNHIKQLFCLYFRYLKLKTKSNDDYNTLRIVDGLTRLAFNHAKLMLKEEVDEEDAFVAMFLCESTLRNSKIISFDPERIFLDNDYFDLKIKEMTEKLLEN